MAPHPVLQQEYLLDQIFLSLCEGCAKDSPYKTRCTQWGGTDGMSEDECWYPIPASDEESTCLHSRMLATCALVSRIWFRGAVAMLWGRFADYSELINLVDPLMKRHKSRSIPDNDLLADKKVCDHSNH
jgi:hypothetical protein